MTFNSQTKNEQPEYPVNIDYSTYGLNSTQFNTIHSAVLSNFDDYLEEDLSLNDIKKLVTTLTKVFEGSDEDDSSSEEGQLSQIYFQPNKLPGIKKLSENSITNGHIREMIIDYIDKLISMLEKKYKLSTSWNKEGVLVKFGQFKDNNEEVKERVLTPQEEAELDSELNKQAIQAVTANNNPNFLENNNGDLNDLDDFGGDEVVNFLIAATTPSSDSGNTTNQEVDEDGFPIIDLKNLQDHFNFASDNQEVDEDGFPIIDLTQFEDAPNDGIPASINEQDAVDQAGEQEEFKLEAPEELDVSPKLGEETKEEVLQQITQSNPLVFNDDIIQKVLSNIVDNYLRLGITDVNDINVSRSFLNKGAPKALKEFDQERDALFNASIDDEIISKYGFEYLTDNIHHISWERLLIAENSRLESID